MDTVNGILYIVAAPSGAGKTSLVNRLVSQLDNIVVSTSHTTRPIRPGEIDGENYFFISQTTYDEMVAKEAFLEHATVYGQSYGTSRQWIENKLNQGIDIILEIDWQGARQVRKLMPDCISIFILPPSLSALRERLLARGQDDTSVIDKRMSQAMNEMSHCDEFDYLLVNDNFDHTVEELASIIQAGRLTQNRQKVQHRELLRKLLSS